MLPKGPERGSVTRPRNDDKDTPFGKWMRGQKPISSTVQYGRDKQKFGGFDGENLDYIWHDYIHGKIMLIEEKQFQSKSRFPQRDTHSIIAQALRYACENKDFIRIKAEHPKRLTYHGYYLIQFENTCPTDGWTKINGQPVTESQLLKFMLFEWFPQQLTLEYWKSGKI